MQDTIDVLTAKNSQLLAERDIGEWIRGTGDGEANNDITAMVQKYITEIEELRAKLCESEMLAEQLRKESAKAKRLSQTFAPTGKLGGSPWHQVGGGGGVVDLSMEDDSGYSVQVGILFESSFYFVTHCRQTFVPLLQIWLSLNCYTGNSIYVVFCVLGRIFIRGKSGYVERISNSAEMLKYSATTINPYFLVFAGVDSDGEERSGEK